VRPAGALVVLSLVLVACGGGSSKSASPGDALVGLFRIASGSCDSSSPTGSWFRMVQPGGNPASGPYVSNPDSTCADATVTALAAGSDGGLRAGSFQPQPDPPFDANGGSTASRVIQPQAFFAVVFGVSTNEKDPQTGATVTAPTITHRGAILHGDLSAVSVSWNQQHFNQGAPKPGGSTADAANGTYDESKHTYSLDWTSHIEGGPFNGFTGMWHFEGSVELAT